MANKDVLKHFKYIFSTNSNSCKLNGLKGYWKNKIQIINTTAFLTAEKVPWLKFNSGLSDKASGFSTC